MIAKVIEIDFIEGDNSKTLECGDWSPLWDHGPPGY